MFSKNLRYHLQLLANAVHGSELALFQVLAHIIRTEGPRAAGRLVGTRSLTVLNQPLDWVFALLLEVFGTLCVTK